MILIPEIKPKQRKKNTHLLKQILIAYHGRGHSTFKCRQIAQLSGMSSSAIGKFYINQFIQMGMIHIYGKTAKGYRYMFNSEWFDNGNEM